MKIRSRCLHNLYTDILGQGLVAVVSISAERYSRSVMVMVAVVAIVAERYIYGH